MKGLKELQIKTVDLKVKTDKRQILNDKNIPN